jgi:hypothetical protein
MNSYSFNFLVTRQSKNWPDFFQRKIIDIVLCLVINEHARVLFALKNRRT